MILNLGSLAFNADITSGGGTPAWGTELGQGTDYKFSFEDMSDFFTGMVYNSVPNINDVFCPLGKGGNQRDYYEFSIASLFKKIFVNGKRVNDEQFLLLIVKRIIGENHVGRRSIKYNPRMTYQGNLVNDSCFKKMAETLGLSPDAAWFVHEINVQDQDELHFTAYTLDEHTKKYISTEARKQDFISKLPKSKLVETHYPTQTNKILQQIFYGAPGTGKSNTIKRDVDDQGKTCFRTTFHPDSDYSTFVGTYKPSMKPTGVTLASGEKEEIITYKFVPQAFTKAYAAAWNTTEDVFLVIEEINRGNCAQIFGDLFQLLDRKGGKSEYPIEADTDLANYLQEALAESPRTDIPEEIKSGERLMLPQNLYIWATMNTSDQSLFPIDSAFKRRWDWVYIPIKPHAEENYKIKIGNETYDWWGFLQKINSVIDDTTHSEDKNLGYFFVNTESKTVCAEKFVSKVLFYLWNDVFKNYGFDHSIFTDNLGVKFTFSDFFNEDGTPNTNRVNDFLKKLDNEIDKEHSFIEITSTETENQGLPNTNE
jgi:type II restriction-modification system restriction subunit